MSTNLRSVSGISEGINPTGVPTSTSLSLLSHCLMLDIVNNCSRLVGVVILSERGLSKFCSI